MSKDYTTYDSYLMRERAEFCKAPQQHGDITGGGRMELGQGSTCHTLQQIGAHTSTHLGQCPHQLRQVAERNPPCWRLPARRTQRAGCDKQHES